MHVLCVEKSMVINGIETIMRRSTMKKKLISYMYVQLKINVLATYLFVTNKITLHMYMNSMKLVIPLILFHEKRLQTML